MVGIISAMQEEMDALLHELKDLKTVHKGMRTYCCGKLFEREVVLVFSRWGKVAAATTATQLINDFELSEILFTGVAGGITNSVAIGDLIIGDELYQHDMNAQPFYKQFEIPILKKMAFKTKDSTKLMKAAQKFLGEFNTYVDTEKTRSFQISHPKVHLGDIASGDQFISSLHTIKTLNKQLPSVLCVEMEGAAVAQVCYEYELPFSILRIISDKANDNAYIDFSSFMKNIASQYALGILKNYFA